MEPWTILVIALLVLGISTPFWGVAGLLRRVGEWQNRSSPRQLAASQELPISPGQVAVLIAAHNEELVITETIASALTLVPAKNIHVISDGSTDSTAVKAEAAGVNCLELSPNRGKAGALSAGIEYFDMADRFEVVLLLDADTRLSPDYLQTGLQLFRDPEVVAVAGRAKSLPESGRHGLAARILLGYRERLYAAVQLLLKYGQASRPANVVNIVPGFASMYRARVLPSIDVEARGLLIEDFNMTFEVHAKRLGRVEFHPQAAVAYTQDPDNLAEYTRQVRRWTLGFWQTVRRHGLHMGRFWAVLALHIVELVSASIVLLLCLPILLISEMTEVALLRPVDILIGVLLPDYLLTVFVACSLRRPGLLLVGLFFPLVRLLDAGLCLVTLVQSWTQKTSGVWVSPTRRLQPT
ncbi:glycosyltransferase family 2 protein [Arthrobacter gandavensis]|uniref:glycosyltransferase family 2 protein n=1 Tax=Arthrobacter gandavensis TaxID=169960 RepID=UPI00188EDF33|nr:glycosyltransferase [Arthrobacter gandavensis]MBF4994076.1 glycosyltransferase family 2 protein [Arthrobacter gandavensis]